MAHTIIDRRLNDNGKSSVNRRKFVKRVRDQVKDAVKDVIRDGNIKDIVDDKGKKIKIPGKGLSQPNFQHDASGGISDRTYPGNKKFDKGDRIKRPEEGDGCGGQDGSPDGEGDDSFDFQLTKDEFLDLFFEDLELPDLVKKSIAKTDEYVLHRAGFSVDGNPARLNIERSMKQAKGRRFALRSPKKKQLKKLEQKLKQIDLSIANKKQKGQDTILDEVEKDSILDQIKVLRRKIKAIPFIDDLDLRYNRWEKIPIPITQAVMFCVMDVSFSMGEWEKEMAKRFYMLLYLFLTRNYERVEIVFIRHHTSAKEVDEDEFFYSHESGGTLVSTAIEMMSNIIKSRYPTNLWNIFGCQASDGDNWPEDSTKTVDLMTSSILPLVQYFAYVEIDKRGGKDSDLWPYYEKLKSSHPQKFDMTVISDVSEIYPVFRGLFEKRD